MIIDCHTHIKCPSSSIDTAEHLDACEKIDACVVLTDDSGDVIQANKEISKYAREHDKVIAFAALNPVEDKTGVKSVNSATKDMGFDGAVLYCANGKFHPVHTRAMRFYESAQQLELPVFFHNSISLNSDAMLEYSQPYLLDEVARSFPSLKIIIGAMGVPFVSQTLCMLGKHENVYADLTISPTKVWEVYNIVVSAYEANVMDKLLFGSGYPFAVPGACIETLLGFNKLLADTNLPTVPREKIREIIERDTLSLLGLSRE